MKGLSFRATVLILFLASFFQSGFAQDLPLSEYAKVSVITCGLGNETYSYFGHTAVRVKDSINRIDNVFNFGAFNFDTPNFVMKFAKGDLQYFAIAHNYRTFIKVYVAEKRSVFEQELLINLEQKQKIFDALNATLLLENRYYTYKFIDKNCTSMVVELINKSLNEEVIKKQSDKDKSYRTILFPYFDGHFYEKLVTSILFGTKVDQDGTKIFLPFELKDSLEKTTYKNHPLAKESETLITYEHITPFSPWNNLLTYIAALLFVVVINKKFIDALFLFVLSSMGIFLFWIGLYSFHYELAMNYNILLFSPLLLLLLVFLKANYTKGGSVLAGLHLLLLGVYTVYIINKPHILIVLPMIITSGIILYRILKNRTKIA
jgi:hypothetical protein